MGGLVLEGGSFYWCAYGMYIALAAAVVKKHRVNLRIGSQMVVVTKGEGWW